MTDSKTEATADNRGSLQSQARQAATTALIEAHREEFNSRMAKECEKRGITWNRKLTKSERAKAELDKLLAANPELVAQLKAQTEAK